MNHAGAFGASGQMDALAGHFERGGGGFRARVGGADGERDFRERARGRAAVAGKLGQSAQDFFDWQLNADHSGGTHKNFLSGAAEAFGGFGDGAFGGGVALRAGGAVGVAGVDDDGAHVALRGAKMLLGNEHRSRGDEFWGEGGGWGRGGGGR